MQSSQNNSNSDKIPGESPLPIQYVSPKETIEIIGFPSTLEPWTPDQLVQTGGQFAAWMICLTFLIQAMTNFLKALTPIIGKNNKGE